MYLSVTIYQWSPCGQCQRTVSPTRHAPAGASTALPTPHDFQHVSARRPHHRAQQLHCFKSHCFFFKQTCCIINHLTMPCIHKVKINTKIRSTVSHSSGRSLLRQTLGTLAKPREQEQAAHRRATLLKGCFSIYYLYVKLTTCSELTQQEH